ncbi:MAG: alpha/beta hydrolase [Spirochaetaceae bacterium]|nr:alpha/beta hydrolase [Spirochaetaceae bacterium]|tara:strand:+ start:24497 stop:25390 length:894 start_codon:yes stop_codon:yes gene_type:complete
MRFAFRNPALILTVIAALHCSPGAQARDYQYQISLSPGYHQDLKASSIGYDIYVPPAPEGVEPAKAHYRLLLVLPGWKFDKSRWIKETDLKQYANRHSMILVLPQMNTSIYASQYFPETRMKWHSEAGLKFINETFIPELRQKFGLFTAGKENYLLGLSTGGRGVALIALSNPDLFVAGASFSGDFDQSVMPSDKLMAAVYGPFDRFSNRWRQIDNPVNAAQKWTMPLYLSHGTSDGIVPPDQTNRFYEAIRKAKGADFPVELKMVEGAAHDFRFWNDQLAPAFAFFQRYFHGNSQL